MPRDPVALKILWQQVGAQLRKNGSGALDLFRLQEEVPDVSAADFVKRIPGGEFAGAVESHDAAFRIENGYQRADGIENCRRPRCVPAAEPVRCAFKSEMSKATPWMNHG